MQLQYAFCTFTFSTQLPSASIPMDIIRMQMSLYLMEVKNLTFCLSSRIWSLNYFINVRNYIITEYVWFKKYTSVSHSDLNIEPKRVLWEDPKTLLKKPGEEYEMIASLRQSTAKSCQDSSQYNYLSALCFHNLILHSTQSFCIWSSVKLNSSVLDTCFEKPHRLSVCTYSIYFK